MMFGIPVTLEGIMRLSRLPFRLFAVSFVIGLTCALSALPAFGSCANPNPNPNPTAIAVSAIADFNGDCKSDIFWNNTSSLLNGIWLMQGFTGNGNLNPNAILQDAPLPPVFWGGSWQVVGIGDFDGDKNADILWRNTSTGQLGIWFMNGGAFKSYALISYIVSDPNWEVAGVGDLNGDGKSDIIWWNKSTGWVGAWLMDGSNYTQASWIFQIVDTNWKIVGVGDFDGDGKSDIFFRHSVSGANAVWLMNGLAIKSGALAYQVSDLNWSVAAVGDTNGDGKSDIIWRNQSTGVIGMWFMNGTNYGTYGDVSQIVGPDWTLVRAGDINGDGKADILWRNNVSGQNGAWLMNGLTISSWTAEIYTIPDQTWIMH